jgi:hypothetical protein
VQRKRFTGCPVNGGPLGLVLRICMQKDGKYEIAILHRSKVPFFIEGVGEVTDR